MLKHIFKLLVVFGILSLVIMAIHIYKQHNKWGMSLGDGRPSQPSTIRLHAIPDKPNFCDIPGYTKRQVEDILVMKRPAFLPNYKNPCWRTNGTNGTLRCLPYFHIIGSPKCATSDLFNRISLHPDVIKNIGIVKETWYWSWRRYGRGHGDPMDFADFRFNCLIPQNDPGVGELVWTTPYLIKHINPSVKLILLLRDPIDRLYSYYFFKRTGKTSDEFHRDVVRSLRVWTECMTAHSERFCLYNYNISNFMKVPLYTSFYSSHLKEWLRVFPREQILVLRTEDYHRDIYGTLEQVYRYLNISSLPAKDLREIAGITEMHQTELKKYAGAMLPETKQLLVEVYRQSTIELSEMLQDIRFTFTDTSFS